MNRLMKLKIINTTDGKYVGDRLEVDNAFEQNEKLVYKGTEFTVEKIIQKGKYITLYCPNYMVVVEVL